MRIGIHLYKILLIVFIAFLSIAVQAQNACAATVEAYKAAAAAYDAARVNLGAAEVALRPVEEFLEANKDIVAHPAESFAEEALTNLTEERLIETLRFCGIHP